MKIIDAHLHLFPSEPGTDAMAEAVGHVNSVDHLRQVYGELNMVHGVVMGNRSLEVGFHHYPRDLFHYCVGLDSLVLGRGETIPEDLPDQVEEHLKREECCGVKLYPGYNKIWLTDPIYDPIYRLAEKYDKPVAVHMGLTAYSRAYLKYSHPLALDEAAADHRRTQFVMCHFGNPFLQEAAAVLEKNRNVSTDLSGLLAQYRGSTIVETFIGNGLEPSLEHRAALAEAAGIPGYTGTDDQDARLMQALGAPETLTGLG